MAMRNIVRRLFGHLTLNRLMDGDHDGQPGGNAVAVLTGERTTPAVPSGPAITSPSGPDQESYRLVVHAPMTGR